MSTIVTKLKEYSTVITTAFGLVATIGGAVLYVENNYAHADDVRDVLKSQQAQIKLYERSQRQNVIFQIEYYDDRIRNLRRQADASPRQNMALEEEIADLTKRRELARQLLIEQSPY